jgi:hypothetical protein
VTRHYEMVWNVRVSSSFEKQKLETNDGYFITLRDFGSFKSVILSTRASESKTDQVRYIGKP